MKKTICILLSAALAASAAPVDFINVLTHTNGSLVAPTNFFDANSNEIYQVFTHVAGPGGTNSPNFIQTTNIARDVLTGAGAITNAEFADGLTGGETNNVLHVGVGGPVPSADSANALANFSAIGDYVTTGSGFQIGDVPVFTVNDIYWRSPLAGVFFLWSFNSPNDSLVLKSRYNETAGWTSLITFDITAGITMQVPFSAGAGGQPVILQNVVLPSPPATAAVKMAGVDGSGNLVANSKIPFGLFPAGVQTNQNGAGLTNLLHSSTVSSPDASVTVALTKNSDGSTNYGLSISGGTSGQVLTATSTGTAWSNAPIASVTSSNSSVVVQASRNPNGATNYDLSTRVYYARLNSDFLVNSNFVNGASSNTNSPASVVLPPGFYEISAVIQAYPDTGTVPMAVGIAFDSANAAYLTSLSGVPNSSSPLVSAAFGNTQANFAFGSSTPSSGLIWNMFGTFYLSTQKTIYLCGSLQAANTNSFKIRTGSYVSFHWLNSSP